MRCNLYNFHPHRNFNSHRNCNLHRNCNSHRNWNPNRNWNLNWNWNWNWNGTDAAGDHAPTARGFFGKLQLLPHQKVRTFENTPMSKFMNVYHTTTYSWDWDSSLEIQSKKMLKKTKKNESKSFVNKFENIWTPVLYFMKLYWSVVETISKTSQIKTHGQPIFHIENTRSLWISRLTLTLNLTK